MVASEGGWIVGGATRRIGRRFCGQEWKRSLDFRELPASFSWSATRTAMRVLFLALLGLASAFGFAPGAMPMQLQRSQASVTLSPQMKALNKPARLSEVRRKYNKHHNSEMRTYIKKARPAPLQLPCPRSAAASRSSRPPALEQRLAPRSGSSAPLHQPLDPRSLLFSCWWLARRASMPRPLLC